MSAGRRWRRQPPAHSPLSGRAMGRAVGAAMGLTADPRPALAAYLRRTFDAAAAVLTARGTQALQFALGDDPAPVALPAYSCFDVATAAVGAERPVVLYDLDPRTLAPDLDTLERALVHGASAVVVAPLYGVPVDWASLEALVARWGAHLIEDAAQGHGATCGGRPLGSLGAASVLSFGRGKGWTGGGGGAALFRRGEHPRLDVAGVPRHQLEAELAGLGGAAAQWLLGRPGTYALPARIPALHLGETRYHPPTALRPMARGTATLLLETADRARGEAVSRRAHAAWYQARLAGARDVELVTPSDGVPGALRYPVLLPQGFHGLADRRAALSLGIAPGYPAPLGAVPAVRPRLAAWCRDRAWPGADALVRRLVTLPTHSLLTPEDRESVARTVGG